MNKTTPTCKPHPVHASRTFGVAAFTLVLLASGSAAAEPQLAEDVSAGYGHSCMVTSCGDVRCWGDNSYGQAEDRIWSDKILVPTHEGAYQAVTTGQRHTCGLLESGRVNCWGDNSHNQLAVPYKTLLQPHLFKQIDAGNYHTCGITTDDKVMCWGNNGDGRATAPSGAFRHVSAGFLHSCAVRQDTTEVVCWGHDGYDQTHGGSVTDAALPFATEGFLRVSAGNYHTCAISDAYRLVCWGMRTYGQVDGQTSFAPQSGTVPAQVLDTSHFVDALGGSVRRTELLGYRQVDAGAWGSCVRWRELGSSDPYDNYTACMGWNMGSSGSYKAPNASALDLSFGHSHGCYVDLNGETQCWGYQWQGAHLPPQLDPMCPEPSFGILDPWG